MARLSRHPVADPPAAPEREKTGHLALRAFATFLLFSGIAHSFWYDLLGAAGTFVLLGAACAGLLAIWIPRLVRSRRDAAFPWRRLPWLAMGYLALAAASLAWSQWPAATAATLAGQLAFTAAALFVADSLTWAELVRSLETALRWIVGLSLLIELWVAAVVRHGILPNFSDAPSDPDPQWYWVRGNLFDGLFTGGRIQGIVGNSNTLGFICLIALILFALRLADRSPGRAVRWIWTAGAAYLFLRAASATAIVSGAVVLAVLVTALLMRRAERPGARTRRYALFTVIAAAAALTAFLLRERLIALLGRSGTLTGREDIWADVWQRAAEHPVVGNGFASPWVPWDPAFDGWIIDHHITVFSAHNMWLDVFLQLGTIGVVLMFGTYAALLWRSWFFAVDRPRWDLVSDRPYRAVTLLPLLVTTALLVHGLAESGPIMLWEWMLAVLFAFAIKTGQVASR